MPIFSRLKPRLGYLSREATVLVTIGDRQPSRRSQRRKTRGIDRPIHDGAGVNADGADVNADGADVNAPDVIGRSPLLFSRLKPRLGYLSREATVLVTIGDRQPSRRSQRRKTRGIDRQIYPLAPFPLDSPLPWHAPCPHDPQARPDQDRLTDVLIDSACPDDLPAIVSLLERGGLPRAGIERHVGTAVVARDGTQVVGCAAVELYGTAGLLRSVAIDPDARGQGLGLRLTDAALALARTRGARTVYLLTETATEFFPRFGFRPIPRDQVAPAVRQSVEFRGACPDTAQAMMAEL